MKRVHGISVQAAIALSIIFSMLLLGGILAWKNYYSVQRIMVSAAGESAQQLGRTLNERARRLIDPPQNVIRLLSFDLITQATSLQQRLERLPLLVESLNANEMLSAIYVGYQNGEFILLRELSSPELKQHVLAPAGGEFLVQSMSLNTTGAMTGEWRFYDHDLKLLETQVKSDYHFDPRTRPWFTEAIAQPGTVMTRPYVFFTTEDMGVTLAQRSANGTAVIGMDVSINDLNVGINDLRMTPNTRIAVLDRHGTVFAAPNSQQLILKQEGEGLRLAHITELGIPSLVKLFEAPPQGNEPRVYQANGQNWYGMRATLSSFTNQGTQLLITVPATEMLVGARRALAEEIRWVAALTALLLVLGWILGHRVGRQLRILADQVHALSEFDFSREVGVRSHVTEIRELSHVLGSMTKAIRNFQAISLTLNHETQLDTMLGKVLERLVDASSVSGGAVYLIEDNSNTLLLAASHQSDAYPRELHLAAHTDQDLARAVTAALGSQTQYLAVPLHDRNQELLGILVLQLTADLDPGTHALQPFRRFVEELSGTAAVAIETRLLIEAQQRLLDAIIELLANAIDAKSPYTGGHCARVPLIAELLLDQAIAADSGPYAEFNMTEAQRYEFRIAAWLHDCGKITSPESVMDKATKLETQYNRIHEIRTRFEVLWRDAEIDFLKALALEGDRQAVQSALERRRIQLQDDFAFIANANIGGERMEDADIERIHQIGTQRWWRHFDNRLGLAHHEASHLIAVTRPTSLPAEEYLLADRPEHLVPWGNHKPPVDKNDPRNIWGFDMDIPEHTYNFGELHNLAVRRGTLTREERFKINEHIVQTIIMLNSLPFPRHLKRVPEIAGNHHEKMDGTGYPRRLSEHDMSIPERMMIIADIFEALTAADRPYKTSKTLSESIEILTNMARTRHIDPQLFRLFLSSGVYLTYSERFLAPSQIDEVDIQHYLDMLDQEPTNITTL